MQCGVVRRACYRGTLAQLSRDSGPEVWETGARGPTAWSLRPAGSIQQIPGQAVKDPV